MASGHGITGGPNRCFPFWQEVLACYVVNSTEENPQGKKKCIAPLEDYYECLHHRKEAARAKAMQSEYLKRWAKGEREHQMTVSEVRQLGLIKDQKPEDVDIKVPRWLPYRGPRIAD